MTLFSEIAKREIAKENAFKMDFKSELKVKSELKDSFGCVNAIKYASDMILTGGDDKRVLLYNNDLDLTIYKGHISNIFSIDTIGTKIYSTGNDGYLLEYDVNQVSRFGKIRVAHEDACHKLSIQSENIILTSGQDYCCKLWDSRVEDPVGVLERRGRRQNGVDFRSSQAKMVVPGISFNSDQYNNDTDNDNSDDYEDDYYEKLIFDTQTDNLNEDEQDRIFHRYNDKPNPSTTLGHDSPIFLTCDDQGGISLYDIRTAFTTKTSKPLKTFNTRLGRVKDSIIQFARKFDVTSAKFSPCGDYIAATIQKYNPLLFSVQDGVEPIAVLEGDGYSSLATIKSGEFSTTLGGMHYLAGGDNGKLYGWRIPDCVDNYARLKDDNFFVNEYGGFVQPMVIKEEIRADGNGEIVNSVSCHPTLPYILAAGVEKVVRLYSPHEMGYNMKKESDPRTEPELDTLEFFQMLIRREQIGIEQYLWKRYRSDLVSITDEDSERFESDIESDISSSDNGLSMEEYDNDSNISTGYE